jgi:hypothetical protein
LAAVGAVGAVGAGTPAAADDDDAPSSLALIDLFASS